MKMMLVAVLIVLNSLALGFALNSATFVAGLEGSHRNSLMKGVVDVIAERNAIHQTDPYILWLDEHARNGATSDILYGVALAIAHFHISFTDINRLALRYENATDKYMRAINRHTDQDGTHFRLFLHDFHELGINKDLLATDVMATMWSPQNTAARDLGYKLFEIGKYASYPGVRYAMIESMESHGNIMFSKYFELVKSFTDRPADDFHFFGEKHLKLEQGHLADQDENEHDLFDTIDMTPEQQQEAIAAVHATWDAFEKWQAGIMETLPKLGAIMEDSKIREII